MSANAAFRKHVHVYVLILATFAEFRPNAVDMGVMVVRTTARVAAISLMLAAQRSMARRLSY
ncbi:MULTISPECIES: hypothetical protein [Rhodococcus]|uniref:Uncharacterized protein n=1 Tax=Rhodococcus erythropolis TaxID=1833 RepID=A0A8I0ZLK3_RHOER|nr:MULTISPECIES: hypothetical protein [Rhodococcus]MBH5141756.1 hypothetical protein [Rhodococcus erythropolis]MBY6386501.1 hypothetical protein [Rhodococcus erythropolis]